MARKGRIEFSGALYHVLDRGAGGKRSRSEGDRAAFVRALCTSRFQGHMKRAWEVVSRNMKNAPKPELVAKRIARLVAEKSPAPRVTVGDPFQSIIAPIIFTFLPPRVRVWGLRRYYKI